MALQRKARQEVRRGSSIFTLPENSRPIWLPPLAWLIRSLLSLPYASITSRKFRDPAQHTSPCHKKLHKPFSCYCLEPASMLGSPLTISISALGNSREGFKFRGLEAAAHRMQHCTPPGQAAAPGCGPRRTRRCRRGTQCQGAPRTWVPSRAPPHCPPRSTAATEHPMCQIHATVTCL